MKTWTKVRLVILALAAVALHMSLSPRLATLEDESLNFELRVDGQSQEMPLPDGAYYEVPGRATPRWQALLEKTSVS